MVAKHVSRLRTFLEEDLWKIKLKSLPTRRAFWYRQIRIWMIAITEFIKDKCSEKASALTYFSLMSIVPVLAMAFAIAQAFGLKKIIDQELQSYFKDQDIVYEKVSEWANNMLGTSGGGVLAGISAIFLIYAVVRLLNNIEVAFNDIWHTPKGRSLNRMVTDYMSIIFLGPIILTLSSSITVFISSELESLPESVSYLASLTSFIGQLIPYILNGFLLFLIYIIFPNASVKLKPALVAGIFAGVAYQLTQIAWVAGQVYMTKYGVIYSSFAALPLFLIWLQLSWSIILFGAELAFAIQNVDNWAYDNEDLKMNQKTKRALTLLILTRIVKFFEQNDKGVDFEDLCSDLNVPRRFVGDAVNDLLSAGLIVSIGNSNYQSIYQPGMDVHKIDIHLAMSKMDEIGMDNLPLLHENEGYDQIVKIIRELDKVMKNSENNKKILSL